MAGAHTNLSRRFVLQEAKIVQRPKKLLSQTCKVIMAIMKQNESECILVMALNFIKPLTTSPKLLALIHYWFK